MEVGHEIKVEVMRYLDAIAAQVQYLAPQERELVLQQLYARISHALERCDDGKPTLHDLRRILADLPAPKAFTRAEPKAQGVHPVTRRGVRLATIGAASCPSPYYCLSWRLCWHPAPRRISSPHGNGW